MTDVAESPTYPSVKSTPPMAVNSRPSTPNDEPVPPVAATKESLAEQSMGFSIAKLLDNSESADQTLSMGETSTLIAMREKIDERLRRSEAEPRLLASNPIPFAFMSQLQLWNILQMMNPGGTNFGSTSKTEPSDMERAFSVGFNLPQSGLQLQDQQRNVLHPLAGVSGNSSNNSDLSRISRESSNASPAGSNASDGGHDEDEFGPNPAGGIRKKKTRTVFSRNQVSQLEVAFNTHRYLNSGQRSQLAITLGLTETQVKIWFQNRRNKWKRQSNGEELIASGTRSESAGSLSTSLPNTVNSFTNLNNTEAFRLLFQSQSSQFNPAQFMNPTGLTLPQLPQMFGLTQPPKNRSSIGNNNESAAFNNNPNNLEFARLFASNFVNSSAKCDIAPNSLKKSSVVSKPESLIAGTLKRSSDSLE